jgi:P pilus assembly chaperone PapD
MIPRSAIYPAIRATAAAALLCASARTATAQITLGVSPIRAELTVAAGEAKTDVISVENRGDKPVRLRVTVADWYLTPDGSPMFVKRGKAPEYSMSDWIEVNPTEFELGEGGRQLLRYTLTVPPGTPAAGYRTSILIETVPDTAREGANVAHINGRIGVILYDRVGTEPATAEIVSQRVGPDPNADGELAVHLTLRNAGRVHFRVSGETRITDAVGRISDTVPIHDAVVLPESEREIIVPLPKALPADGFTLLSRVDVGLPDMLEAETRVAPAAR